ncbi:MAG: hypothetical protein HY508_07565 [Acidobacteria bacterium]|nr:hypothetical protein [Acidobacteriota bacterium]
MKPPRLLAVLVSSVLLSAIATGTRAESQAIPTAKSRSGIAKRHSPLAPQQPPIIFVQAPEISANQLARRFPQGSWLVRTAGGSAAQNVVNLTPEFFAAADPQVSFDASKVLFSAQPQPGAPWQIWEMRVDGSAKRQVTRLESDCLRPGYLAHEALVFTVVTAEGGRPVSQIYVASLDGSEAHPITFGPGNFQVETVLKDGRILVSAASPLAPGTQESGGLYVMRHDGTGLASFRCEHRQPARHAQAAELADGSIVFVKNTPGQTGAGGELAMIRRGALHNSSLSPGAAVSWSPRPQEGAKLIVARTNPASGKSKFDLYTFDPASGRFGEPVFHDSKLSSVQAAPVTAHEVPRWYWSTLNPQARAGHFVCLDAYQSADEPTGRIAASVARVRLLILENGEERSLGEAPVESDGSFYVGVPADKPVRFELLNNFGAVIRAQRSWIWARPGEERGCVGCHEDKSVAPENRWPLALRRFDTPTRLGVEAETMRVAH